MQYTWSKRAGRFTLIELLACRGVVRRTKRSTNFTLIELLVVIAVIGILMTLLLPALSRAKKISQKATCSNNVKQQGMLLQYYADDYDSLYWSEKLKADTPTSVCPSEAGWLYFWGLIYPSVKKSIDIWRCPSASRDHNQKVSSFFSSAAAKKYFYSAPRMHSPQSGITWFEIGRSNGPYSWGAYVIDGKTYQRPICWRASQIRKPSETMAFADSNNDGCNWDWVYYSLTSHGGDYHPSARHIGPAKSVTDMYGNLFAYRGSGNYVFFDGHAESHNPIPVSAQYQQSHPDAVNFWAVVKP